MDFSVSVVAVVSSRARASATRATASSIMEVAAVDADTVLAWARGRLVFRDRPLGELLTENHQLLRQLDVSTPELDSICDLAIGAGAYGAKLSGAGFGGCAVALVASTKAERFVEMAASDYEKVTGLQAAIYICKATDGAEISECSRST